jgi:hypothetical protein
MKDESRRGFLATIDDRKIGFLFIAILSDIGSSNTFIDPLLKINA